VTTDAQRRVVTALKDYADDMAAHAKAGRGVVLLGGVGCGKDHLLAALARVAIERYHASTEWIRGVDLFSRFRDAIRRDADEESIVGPLCSAPVLVVSDPLPPVGAMTEFQAAAFLRIIDERYRMLRPTWLSINVASGAESDQRMGAQVSDRLRDGGLCLYCDWPSYRKPLAIGDTTR
jgi:DNA replication protein DnaC